MDIGWKTNEPATTYEGQDGVLPATYAPRYHEIHTFLKQQDPTAQVFAGGVVQATPLRLEYLNQILAAYQISYSTSLPADGWHTHEQILQEKRDDWGCGIPPGFEGVNTGTLYSIADLDNLIINNCLINAPAADYSLHN